MRKKLLILGGGFGVYGYLPAAISSGWSVSTLERYRETISGRPELSWLLPNLDLLDEDEIQLCDFHGVVLARTPRMQLEVLKSNHSFQGHFYLEKPLGANSVSHAEALGILETRGQRFSVGYLFRYQEWYQKMFQNNSIESSLRIRWVVSKSYDYSWKRKMELGGGLLSYYGVHLLSLLVELGYDAESLNIESSQEFLIFRSLIPEKKLTFSIEYSSDPLFEAQVGDRIWSLASPFGPKPSFGNPDPRLGALAAYLNKAYEAWEYGNHIDHEYKVLKLRECVERLL